MSVPPTDGRLLAPAEESAVGHHHQQQHQQQHQQHPYSPGHPAGAPSYPVPFNPDPGYPQNVPPPHKLPHPAPHLAVQNTGHNPNLAAQGGGAGHHPPIAPGFQAIVAACQKLYPEQRNPLQMSTVVKFWLGGSDPLDYVTVYSNNQEVSCCPHWHYVSCGLTDLHGDGRVHAPAQSPLGSSGHGFELTFRLRRRDELVPPSWPVKVMQTIAKYVFTTDNTLVPGDHVTWDNSLGGSPLLRHLLVSEDSQLEPVISGPLGSFRFYQLTCCTESELKAVQRWNGPGVLKLLQSCDLTGGQLLITDTDRQLCLFEAVPEAKCAVEAGIAKEGSNFCGMTTFMLWAECEKVKDEMDEDGGVHQNKDKNALTDWNDLASQCDKVMTGGLNSKSLYFPDRVELACNLETARHFPLCVRGRLKHGCHFTLKSVINKDIAVTLVTERVGGTLVSLDKPFAAQGDWLQLLIHTDELDDFYNKVCHFESDQVNLPQRINFPRFTITVVDDVDKLRP